MVNRFNYLLLATSFGLFAHKIGVGIAENGTVDLLQIWPELGAFTLALIVNNLIRRFVLDLGKN
jgi:hypothetical protein